MDISSRKELEEAIIRLEKKKVAQRAMMMHYFQETTESLKPGNLMRGAMSKVAHSPTAKGNIVKTLVSIGVGMLTKRLFMGGHSHGFIQKLLANALRIGTAKTVMSNADKIKSYGVAIFNNLFRKSKKNKTVLLS